MKEETVLRFLHEIMRFSELKEKTVMRLKKAQ
jgi:hypothetical protein